MQARYQGVVEYWPRYLAASLMLDFDIIQTENFFNSLMSAAERFPAWPAVVLQFSVPAGRVALPIAESRVSDSIAAGYLRKRPGATNIKRAKLIRE